MSNSRILTGPQLAKFTVLVALFAILADAAIGHGLTWKNDPYWTYWITKTFLIATVFGVGTALIGIGRARGAVIAAVHTLILTVYYWTLSPVGLPSSPEWLDLEHTWLTGLPIHFGVIYLGYLTALWVWRNRLRGNDQESAKSLGLRAFVVGLAIVLVAGTLSNIALGEFSGFTWYLVRLLITVPFLILWWGAVGRTVQSSVTGGLVLASIWASYSQFLSPVGLPDTPLRIISQAPPPATVHWLDYNQLWLISLPIYIVTMVSILVLSNRARNREDLLKPLLLAAVAIFLVTLITASVVPDKDSGVTANIKAQGKAMVETGTFYSNQFEEGTGQISITSTDTGNRVSPLPPHDKLNINANVQVNGQAYEVVVTQPIIEDPMGRHTTWWGVGYNVEHHGKSGIGTDKLPTIKSEVAAFGIGDVMQNSKVVAAGVPVHIMTSEKGFPQNARLELDVGDPNMTPIPGIPSGHLRVLWSEYEGGVPNDKSQNRYIGGSLVLIALLLGVFKINKPEGIR